MLARILPRLSPLPKSRAGFQGQQCPQVQLSGQGWPLLNGKARLTAVGWGESRRASLWGTASPKGAETSQGPCGPEASQSASRQGRRSRRRCCCCRRRPVYPESPQTCRFLPVGSPFFRSRLELPSMGLSAASPARKGPPSDVALNLPPLSGKAAWKFQRSFEAQGLSRLGFKKDFSSYKRK